MNHANYLYGAVLACAITSAATPALANYSQVVVFGDSLSDNGNLKALTGSPGAPYYQGRFSNGPVAVEVMAQRLGLPLKDYAYGGAQTGLGNYLSPALNGTGVQGQVGQYGAALQQAGASADPSALYVVWAGPNDFFPGAAMFSPATSSTASANILSDLYGLYQLGARNFFVPLMPDLSVTPAARQADAANPGYRAAAAARTSEYNQGLIADLQTINSSWAGANALSFDTASFLTSTAQTFGAAGYNVTDACFSGSSVCSNPNNYLFWDGVHPTAVAHGLLGQAFAAAIPEPSSALLLMFGLALGCLAKKKQITLRNQPPI